MSAEFANFVTSRDSSRIAFDRMGNGPALVMVGGALDDGSENVPLARELAGHFTVYNYARRGRANSGDNPPYAVAREVEDLGALLAEAGGAANVYGVSSGGALALECAAAGLPIVKLAVYEVPYDVAEDAQLRHDEYLATLGGLLAENHRAEALTYTMSAWGSPEELIAMARQSPTWPGLLELAPTLAYDGACIAVNQSPGDRLTKITAPTLVLTGDANDFFHPAADVITALLPRSERRTITGQEHVVEPTTFAPILREFFADNQ